MGSAPAEVDAERSRARYRAANQGGQRKIRASAAFGFKRSCPMRRLMLVVCGSRRIEIARLAKVARYASRRGDTAGSGISGLVD